MFDFSRNDQFVNGRSIFCPICFFIPLFCLVMGIDKKYRVTLLLHYYEGYSIREIAHIMNLSENTVSTRLARGRKILKELITAEE